MLSDVEKGKQFDVKEFDNSANTNWYWRAVSNH